MLKDKMKIKNTKKGYTLLFAVLTATLVLGVAVFILSVSKKQYQLAIAARESMFALYAADSGIECAVWADKIGDLATSTVNQTTGGDEAQNAKINCNGILVEATPYTVNNTLQTDNWSGDTNYKSGEMKLDLQIPSCTLVTVYKGNRKDNGGLKTVIESKGYNSCDGNGPTQSNRTVERLIRLTTQ